MNLYEDMGLPDELGCVMAPLVPGMLKDLQARVPRSIWVGEPEDPGHVTLLYGLLTPPVRMEHVREVLSGWQVPSYFDAVYCRTFGRDTDNEVVVLTTRSQNLGPWKVAHQHLSRLPHVNTFPEYTPHVTLGRVLPGTGGLVEEKIQWELDNRRTPLALKPTGGLHLSGPGWGLEDLHIPAGEW